MGDKRLLRLGVIEPHLRRVGGIRRLVELTNRLVDLGHEVTFFLPEGAELRCDWLPCRARVEAIREQVPEPFDLVLFNHEPQWHLLACFPNATATCFYALAYSRLYGKSGSWEAAHAQVDLRLANSEWTAQMIEEDVGERPAVLLGGVSHEYFHPVEVEKRYPILCPGDPRPWKGTDTIERAAALLDLPLERYEGKDLPQERMAEEYGRAEVFVVGSPVDGFGQPGLEALACGVPLVTTDNGGCREYAIHEQTALVVPPGDPEAMAAAIARIRSDPALAATLVRNGLELARTKFDWDAAAAELERLLVDTVERVESQAAPASAALLARDLPERPVLSIVSPVWNELAHTQRFVESIRQHTDVPYELILVDNGSDWPTANYLREAGDVHVRNERNLGFAVAMNQGLAHARGEVVAFCNNDTMLPAGWASPLVEHLRSDRVGIVVPALTKTSLQRTVRQTPGDTVEVIAPFEAPPPAVVYLMRTDTARKLGGFGEEYEIASGEDTDLAFKSWVNGLDMVFDSRILVRHRAKGTARNLDDWVGLWRRNREVFLAKWMSADPGVPRLESCPPDAFEYRLQVASSVAGWMSAYFKTRDKLKRNGKAAAKPRPSPSRRLLRRGWRIAAPFVPQMLARALRRRYRARAAAAQ